MKDWLDSLAPRERMALLAGVGLLLLLLIYVAVWRPLAADVVRLRHATAEQVESLGWMRSAAMEVPALKRGVAKAPAALGGSLLAVVDRAATQAQVKDRIRRIQPDTSQMVRVDLEAVDFNRLIAWLGTLQQQGINTTSLSLSRVETTHQVDARLTLERPAK